MNTSNTSASEANKTETKKSPKNKISQEKVTFVQTLGIILIVLGVLGMLLPFFNSYLLRKNSHIDLTQLSAKQMAEASKMAEDFDFNAIREIGYFDFWSLLGKWEEEDIMAELVIPSLHIDLAIFNNSANENLLAGVGRLYADRIMGDSNFVVTGHHVSGRNVLLHNLMEAHVGDTIYVTDKAKIYVYRTIDTVQKDTDAIYMVADDRNEFYGEEALISIMTCYQGKASSRWFVVGKLIDIIDYNPAILEAEYPDSN